MLFENIIRSLPRERTLKLECGRCGRRTEWTRPQAMKALGPGATPADVRRRVCCGRCGERAAVSVWI